MMAGALLSEYVVSDVLDVGLDVGSDVGVDVDVGSDVGVDVGSYVDVGSEVGVYVVASSDDVIYMDVFHFILVVMLVVSHRLDHFFRLANSTGDVLVRLSCEGRMCDLFCSPQGLAPTSLHCGE